jgi:UDP-glucose 4-epimerase
MVMPTFHGEVVTAINVLTAVTEGPCRRIVMAGSMEAPEMTEAPSSPYAAAKAATRSYGRMFHRVYGTPVVRARIFMTYGPGQAPKKIIPFVITALLQGLPVRIASTQRMVDWVYVDDVVGGLLAVASTAALEGQSIDLGSGELTAIGDVVRRIEALIGPGTAVEHAATKGRQDEEVRCANVGRTLAMTGWRPVIPLGAGLKLTVDFHAQALGMRVSVPA